MKGEIDQVMAVILETLGLVVFGVVIGSMTTYISTGKQVIILYMYRMFLYIYTSIINSLVQKRLSGPASYSVFHCFWLFLGVFWGN